MRLVMGESLVALSHVTGQLVGLELHLRDVAHHVEGHLGEVVVLALQDALESGDCVSNANVLACSQ